MLFVKAKPGLASPAEAITNPVWMIVLWSMVTSWAPSLVTRNPAGPPHEVLTSANRL